VNVEAIAWAVTLALVAWPWLRKQSPDRSK